MLSSLIISTALLLGAETWLPEEYVLRNIAQHVFPTFSKHTLPIVVPPFEEHVLGEVPALPEGTTRIRIDAGGQCVADETPVEKLADGTVVNQRVSRGSETWYATDAGLYRGVTKVAAPERWPAYGVGGPLATTVRGAAVDSSGTLWLATPLGLSAQSADGAWRHVTGRDGLPVEDLTAIAVGANDELWLGSSHGAILYRPAAEGRKFFYRAGPRYLPGDDVKAIAVSPDNKAVYFLTNAGLGKLEIRTTTLLARAQAIEKAVNERHRREGLVASCVLDKDGNYTIHDNDNDGLWTAYHVAAMSLRYGATKDDAAKASAKESMHALYMLQNASGKPGLVARSVLPPELGVKKGEQWQPTPDGKFYWKSDTSSDEIDGHYLAFYTYFEHIAQYDPEERALIEKQVRALTDYLVDNGYQLIDWHGKRTRWGFWDPKSLNENPMDYVENGLNSLQMLSFLKVTLYITGDAKYAEHYKKLAVDHHYLENLMLTKKSHPEENNHSDDQLGFVAWYPILQLEKDPKARQALLRGVSRHYEVVRPEQPSFYTFAYATINSGAADLDGAIENLRQIPTDRRTWAQKNSHRADVQESPHRNRFGKPVLTRVLPADERVFEKWNADPYLPDDGGDGRHEDDGAAFLLPYWMGRFHGFIAEQE